MTSVYASTYILPVRATFIHLFSGQAKTIIRCWWFFWIIERIFVSLSMQFTLEQRRRHKSRPLYITVQAFAVVECHGLVPWSVTLVFYARRAPFALQMPRPCAVVLYVPFWRAR